MLTEKETARLRQVLGRELTGTEEAALAPLRNAGGRFFQTPHDGAAVVKFTENTKLAAAMCSRYADAAAAAGESVLTVLAAGAFPVSMQTPLHAGEITDETTVRFLRQSAAGTADCLNTINVPVLSGYQTFDERFTKDPLANAACLGIFPAGQPLPDRVAGPGTCLFLYGTSRPDHVAGVIQATGKMIGNGIIQACRVPGETGLFGAVVAICESRGAEIDTGDGNDALFSGSSCRVLAAVQPGKAADAAAVCRKYGLQSAAAGKVTGNDRLVARSCGSVVCDLPVSLFAEKSLICGFAPEAYDAQKPFAKPAGSLKDLALKVLSHPELADGSLNSAQFNTQAQGRTYTITPFYSVLELDGLGCSLVCGGNARHMYLNPYAGGANTILELASHLASVGGTPLCALGTLNFGSPESLWQAEEAVKGMEDMCRALHVPSVSGTVSFRPGKNPAPAVSMLGRGDLIGWEWPDNNDMIAVVGVTQDDLGGSVLDAVTGCGGKAPEAGDIRAVPVIRDLVEKALVSGCMAVTRGGLLYALVNLAAQADVAIAGDPLMKLFSETCGRFLVTFSDEYHLKESGLPYEVIGRITAGGKLVIRTETEEVVLTQQELFTAGSTLTRACRAQ